MVLCAAPNCNIRYGQGVSMFSFPEDPKLCQIWVRKLKTINYWPSKHSKLCERHFTPDCFIIEPSRARCMGYSRLQLKKDAIPSMFDYTPLDTKAIKGHKRKTADVDVSYVPKQGRTSKVLEKRRALAAQNLNEDAEIILPPPSQFQDSPETLNTEPSCQSGAHTMTFEMSTQTNYGLVKRRHVSIQTEIRPSTISTGTQTETMFSLDAPEDLDESFESLASTDSAASEWIPPDLDENNNIDHHHVPPSHCRRKFIVFEECLDQLLQICTICGQKCDIKKTIVGTLLFVSRVCVCGETFTWGSQPFTGSIPTGNLVLSAAILISGSSINQSLTMFQHANISCFSERTYHNIQQHYLVPAVERVWKVHQDAIFDVIRQQNVAVVVGGDARCCSPGHTAKYGSYSLMDLELRQILDVQLVQSNEVKSSYWMEMEGLTRCLKRVEEEGVVISDLVTDRHPQIKAYMKKERSDINHWFDVWHMAKGVFKKLEAIGKKKKYKQVGDWARSVSNHLYWCAASSEGDGELVSEKWLSILNHITDVHEGHGKRFPKCLHGDLEDRDWIKKGSLAFQEMEKVVKGRLLVQDIKKLSPAEQTSALEAYHNVVCHFAPKSLHFFYASMKARLYIAALHFNENSSRDQAVNKSGELIYSVSYPKGRNGAGIPKEVKIMQWF
ncbi:uncharacterized protein LOC133192121 isoform X2 [Saccostrea echinata]|uniref:uncharacterized protein LOC133192121 isoform X2 n=1 Tax=Saccostrea echinata TaxID=191078 RepID=UPI002A835EAC|nr:uncharacterized protein LOC133192121 isoform X2 [Saccostrea echinata]